MSRRNAVRLLAAGLLVGLLAVVSFAPVPYVTMSPGPTFDTLGEVGGEPLISIDGTETFSTSGQLDLTTVSERGEPRSRVHLGQALWGWVNPDIAVVPEQLVNPDNLTEEEVREQSTQAMELSQENAVAAALNQLDLPRSDHVVVREVSGGTPADGALEPGDVIIAVDGTPITDVEQVPQIVGAVEPGAELVFTVQRDGDEQDVAITTAARPDDPTAAFVGISAGVITEPDGFSIDVQIDNVGGPSAGLMFSLGIVDKLTEIDETGGLHVAGTGTIDNLGTVGPIGGIRQKLIGARDAGASVFLAPQSNCNEVVGNVPDGLRVIAVSTLSDALSGLEAVRDGGEPPTCQAEAA
jgi:PDZ domain-containing protein